VVGIVLVKIFGANVDNLSNIEKQRMVNKGHAVINLLHLKKDRSTSKYETTKGNKSFEGVFQAIEDLRANKDVCLGRGVVDLFSLKVMRGSDVLYKTSFGTKTSEGIGVVVERIFKDKVFCESFL